MKRRELGVMALSVAALASLGTATVARGADIRRGGTLNVMVDLEPASMDPIMGNAPGSDRRFYNLFIESLLSQDEQGELQPRLAESWSWSDDRLALTFKLRQNVLFHDGTPFDAEAVKFNLERVIDPAVNARARQYVGDLAGAEVVDSHTVKVLLKAPTGAILPALAVEAGSMVSPTAVKSLGEGFARKPVGTGPFKLVSWTSGTVEAERFDKYWQMGEDGQPLPYLDKVVARVNANTAVKIVELKGGSLQLGDTIQVKDFEQVERDSNLVLVDTIQGPAQYVSFNNTKAPFDNIDLRKAIAYAINREGIEKAISRGQGVVLTALEPPSAWSFGNLKGHPYDPALAKEHYAKSGHSGPITLSVIQRDPDTQIAQLLQAMLKTVGITLKIEVMERQAWVEKTLGYNYEMGILRATLPRPDPDMDFGTYYGRTATQDYSGIKNPQLWDLVDKARTEVDQAKRKEVYVEAQQLILDNFWQTYLFWRPTKEVARKELQGFAREFGGAWVYDRMWLSA